MSIDLRDALLTVAGQVAQFAALVLLVAGLAVVLMTFGDG